MDSELQHYDDKIRPIERIEFNILGNDEIKRLSALDKKSKGIDIPDLYDNMDKRAEQLTINEMIKLFRDINKR